MHIVPYLLPRPLCGWARTSLHLLEEGHNHLIVRFTYLCHMIGEELAFSLLLIYLLYILCVYIRTCENIYRVSVDLEMLLISSTMECLPSALSELSQSCH